MRFNPSSAVIRRATEEEIRRWPLRGDRSFGRRVACAKEWRMLSNEQGSVLIGLLSPLPMCRGHECSVSLAERYAETGDDLRWGFFLACKHAASAWVFPDATTRAYVVDANNLSLKGEFLRGDFDPPYSLEKKPRAWFEFVARAFHRATSPMLCKDADALVAASMRQQRLFLDLVRYAVEFPCGLAGLVSFEMPSPLPTLMDSLTRTSHLSFAPTVLARRNKAQGDLYARCAQSEAGALLLALKEKVWKPFIQYRRSRGLRYGSTDLSDPLVCSRLKQWRIVLANRIEARARKGRSSCFRLNVYHHAVLGAPFACAHRKLIESVGRTVRKIPQQKLADDVHRRSVEIFRILTKNERRAVNAAFPESAAVQIAARAGFDAIDSLPIETLWV